MLKILPKDMALRKWILQVLIILLIFGLLAWGVWLFYNYQVSQLHEQQSNTTNK